MMTKLTDTQSLLLATAAKRETLSLYPLPTTLKPGGGLHKALAALRDRGLVEERETNDRTAVSREHGDLRYGLFATAAGLAALGIEDGATDGGEAAAPPVAPPAVRAESKTAQVLALLQRDEGATLDQLVAATGWLPHTARAALTGIRKEGYEVTSEKVDGTRFYRVFPPVSR